MYKIVQNTGFPDQIYRKSDKAWIPKDSGNRYYLVAQEGGDIRVQSVFDTENFSTQFDKLLDITSLGYEDKLGGATASNFYNNFFCISSFTDLIYTFTLPNY